MGKKKKKCCNFSSPQKRRRRKGGEGPARVKKTRIFGGFLVSYTTCGRYVRVGQQSTDTITSIIQHTHTYIRLLRLSDIITSTAHMHISAYLDFQTSLGGTKQGPSPPRAQKNQPRGFMLTRTQINPRGFITFTAQYNTRTVFHDRRRLPRTAADLARDLALAPALYLADLSRVPCRISKGKSARQKNNINSEI